MGIAPSDPDGALQVVERIQDPGARDRAVGAIGVRLAAAAPERGLALILANEPKSPSGEPIFSFPSELGEFFRALARANPDKAVALTGTLPEGPRRAQAIVTVASTVAEADPDKALAIARGISDPVQRVSALQYIALRLLSSRESLPPQRMVPANSMH
jgi:hypothetical protein